MKFGGIEKNRKTEFFAGIALSFALCFMLFFYAPLELYFQNMNEFWYDIYLLAPPMFLLAVLAFLGSTLLLFAVMLVGKRVYHFVIGLYALLFLCTYIQGNYLAGWLPALDGSEFDWSGAADQRYATVAVWLIVGVLIAALYHFLKWERFNRVVGWAGLGFSLMLGLTLLIVCIMNGGFDKRSEYVMTDKDMLTMSSEKNFVILLLDAVSGEDCTAVMAENPEYAEAFQDFTYFSNITAGYPLTRYSIPFIFSGEWFENKESYTEWIPKAFAKSPILNRMEEDGYAMGMYESDVPSDESFRMRFENAVEKKLGFESITGLWAVQSKMVGLRYLPFDFKRFCHTDLLHSMRLLRQDNTSLSDDKAWEFEWNLEFEGQLDTKSIALQETPTFKFIHLDGAHVAFNTRLSEEGIVIDEENSSYMTEVEVSLYLAKRFVEELKESDVLDNTVIVIMSDHGNNGLDKPENMEKYLARVDSFLFVKGFGEKHAGMQVSHAPVSHEDMSQAFMKLADGLESKDIFDWKEGDDRERRFLACMIGEKNEAHMEEYVQTGEAGDFSTLKFTGREFIYE